MRFAGGYALFEKILMPGLMRGLCVWFCVVSPLDVDTVCLNPACIHFFLLGPCKLLKWLLQRSRSGSLLSHPHHSEALLIAVELKDVKRGYAQGLCAGLCAQP